MIKFIKQKTAVCVLTLKYGLGNGESQGSTEKILPQNRVEAAIFKVKTTIFPARSTKINGWLH